MLHLAAKLRGRIRDRKPVLGHLLRTPAPELVEVAATTGLDFITLDTEHAAFGPRELEMCLLAARAARLPALVRTPDGAAPAIQQALDLGASGIIVPHVGDDFTLRKSIDATRLGPKGSRGFSTSHRAAGYGSIPAGEFMARNNESIIVIAQIEDRAGLNNIETLAQVADLDAMFIGRADLACALDETSIHAPSVEAAADRILDAGRRHARCTGVFLPTVNELATMHARGATFFMVGTDQGLLAAALKHSVETFMGCVHENG